MKPLRLATRGVSPFQPPRNPRIQQHHSCLSIHPTATKNRREHHSTAARPIGGSTRHQQKAWHIFHRSRLTASADPPRRASTIATEPADATTNPYSPPPPPSRPFTPSAKLSALHARLSLPAALPLSTLSRCLIDRSADPRPAYNNTSLAILGQELLALYTAENLLCNYPRLPLPVLFAAQYAYVGPAALGKLRAEWGVEVAAAPGKEVELGVLQLKRVVPAKAAVDGDGGLMPLATRLGTGRKNAEHRWRRGMSSRIVYDDEFGDLKTGLDGVEEVEPYPGAAIAGEPSAGKGEQDGNAFGALSQGSQSASDKEYTGNDTFSDEQKPDANASDDSNPPTTVEAASSTFIRALIGALYLHTNAATTQSFHAAHIMSRHLPLHQLFHFTHPTRDLSRLCAREGFEPPVARLLSETGRRSRSPVFVVGVFCGDEVVGEGAGASLNEARIRAAAAALRAWYLYRVPEEDVRLPSRDLGGKGWRPQMVDRGEVVT
ncbi:hypothetical protein M433DRAFT_153439 [Acidomyces richmondensis BFW]|nr:MAG: hypothetical protein FE78DRAFT_89080 [Acidomyces sp. 'richmondensis']KYG46372.1 hypothetical protein M433DRAFT_153439 [Acidomyces richmondensis BFW]